MKDIRFSIVIPAYNASESIVTTLDCVKAQTYRNFEVIIVDDKSADAAALAEVVRSERYQDLDINLVLSEVKLNGAGARNKGIELATGKRSAQGFNFFTLGLIKVMGHGSAQNRTSQQTNVGLA